MARKLPEMGYYLYDGGVRHGIMGLCPGTPISEAEARAISAEKRAREPKPEAKPAAVPPAAASQVAELEAQVHALTAEVSRLKGALVDLLNQAKGS